MTFKQSSILDWKAMCYLFHKADDFNDEQSLVLRGVSIDDLVFMTCFYFWSITVSLIFPHGFDSKRAKNL